MIGRLLGHADIASTLRYAHLAQGAERDSAARIGHSIGTDIGAGRPSIRRCAPAQDEGFAR